MFYVILIPTTIFNRIAPTALVDALRADVKLAMANAFGGYTETVGTGGYVAQSGELIEETVYQIESYASEPNDELVAGLAERIKTALSQESVMVKVLPDMATRFM